MGETFTRAEVDEALQQRGFELGQPAFQRALRLTYVPTDDPNLFVEREVPTVISPAEYEEIRAVAPDQAFFDLYDRHRTNGSLATHATALAAAKREWLSVNAD